MLCYHQPGLSFIFQSRHFDAILFQKSLVPASQFLKNKKKLLLFFSNLPFLEKHSKFFSPPLFINIHISQSNLSQSFQKPKNKIKQPCRIFALLNPKEKTTIKASIHSVPYCSSYFCLLAVAFSYYL
jgi:hypothetical protein